MPRPLRMRLEQLEAERIARRVAVGQRPYRPSREEPPRVTKDDVE